MKNPISLTARISLQFAATAACVLFAAGLVFERVGENQLQEHYRMELDGKMELVRNALESIPSSTPTSMMRVRLREAIVISHPGIAIAVAASDGTVLFSVGQSEVVKHLIEGAEIGKPTPVIWALDHRTYRIRARHLALGIPASQPANVAIALDITEETELMAEFMRLLWFSMALAALALGWLGWVAVRKGLAPLHDMSTTVANVSAQQLDKPLPAAGVPHELQELVSAFNRMLAQLHDSFRRLSEFSSDIAHELRTPINNMMMQTQVILSRERDTVDYRANLQSNLEELERMSRMVSDMLFLAKADNSLVAPNREEIDLREEVVKLFDFYEALASARHIHLAQSGAATVCADRMMIQRALSNVLSNAIRFTPEGMRIEVTIGENADRAMIAIDNPGPEIPAEHLPRIFERLYRVDAARREGDTENTGLGLAITKSIVEMHGGTIYAESAKGRTRFTITLPQRETV
ncbi:MAG: heavy metal sensor histidine kinase [Nitrosomonadales bacterium]|nr:heavy metal sensor histidine kinase [Nitrosomonadales bacterium]